MFEGKKVIAVTPAGRRCNLEILAPYMLRDRGIIDKWVLWLNTPHSDDVACCRELREKFPDFVEILELGKFSRKMPQPMFYETAIDPDAIYLKYDDDICYVHRDAVDSILRYRSENPEYFVVMGNIINNGMCAAIHQRNGSMDFKVDGKIVKIDRNYDNKLYRNTNIANYVHRTFIEDVLNNDVEKYLFPEYPLGSYENFSINLICWEGERFAGFGGKVEGDDEERWICCIKTRNDGIKNSICGGALVAHHAFYTQRRPFCGDQPEIDPRILKAYRSLAVLECGVENCEKAWGFAPQTEASTVRRTLNAKSFL